MTRRAGLAGHGGARVVALGGGHGLAATLQALRRLTGEITAIVGVSDDGGSSGRLRADFGTLPPGDLRMALAALCGDDTWGRTWEKVIQHRFSGSGPLAGHALGNLLITALWEETADPVVGLAWVGALLQAQGTVLPCSTVPLEIIAEVQGVDPAAPDAVEIVRGQVAVATTPGDILAVRLEPADPPACVPAIEALAEAELVVLGPGSWFTSVMPHLLIPDLAHAIRNSPATRVVVLNLDPDQDSETERVPPSRQLTLLRDHDPTLRIDAVIADPRHVGQANTAVPLERVAAELGARLVVSPVGYPDGRRPGVHDPARLAVALGALLP